MCYRIGRFSGTPMNTSISTSTLPFLLLSETSCTFIAATKIAFLTLCALRLSCSGEVEAAVPEFCVSACRVLDVNVLFQRFNQFSMALLTNIAFALSNSALISDN